MNEKEQEARREFNEDAKNWDAGNCVYCLNWSERRAQHWNDVGGPSTLMCEDCYVKGITSFWEDEELAEKAKSDPDWVGECGWCGAEVPIFGHTDCPAIAELKW